MAEGLPWRLRLGRLRIMRWTDYKRGGVRVVPWDARVPEVFAFVRDEIVREVPRAGVEHIGSTAVPGLSGKGTVDVMVLAPMKEDVAACASALEKIGLHHAPGSRPERPFLFSAVESDEDGSVTNVHVHVIVASDSEAETQRGFSAALRADAGLRDEYAVVKQKVVDAGVMDPTQYSIDKGDWVVETLDKLGLPPLPDNGPPPPQDRK